MMQRWMTAWNFTIGDNMQHGHRDRRMALARFQALIDQGGIQCHIYPHQRHLLANAEGEVSCYKWKLQNA